MDPPDKDKLDPDNNRWQTVAKKSKRKLSLRGSDSENSLNDTESDSDMESFPGGELPTKFNFISEKLKKTHQAKRRKDNPREPEEIKKTQSHIPKHIVVLSGATTYSKLSIGDLQLTKFIKTTIGDVKSVKRTKQGEVAVECIHWRQVATLLQQNNIGHLPITTRQPKNLIESKGVIKNINLDDKIDDIVKTLKLSNDNVKIIEAKRLQNRFRQESEAVAITFGTPHLPQSIKIGYTIYRVEKYYRHPTRCGKCQSYTHSMQECKSNIKCPRCSGQHPYSECTASEQDKVCPNCGESHSAGYKNCRIHKQHVKIIKTQTIHNISYASAVRKINQQMRPIPTPQPRLIKSPKSTKRPPKPTPRKSLIKKKEHSIQSNERPFQENKITQTKLTINEKTSNMNITVNVLDFLNFIREAARVVSIGTQRAEPSESVRNKLAEVSNVYLGTSIKPDDLQKRAQETLSSKPKEMEHLNKMIGALLKTSNKTTITKDTLKKQNNFPLTLTPEITVINNQNNTRL